VWRAFEGSEETSELAKFAILLLNIIVNQARCEHTFSDLRVKQMDRRSRLGLKKLKKMTKVCYLIFIFEQLNYC
jgi:hypothetical protein